MGITKTIRGHDAHVASSHRQQPEMELEPMRVDLVRLAAIATDGLIPSNTLLGKQLGFRAPRLQLRELVGAWRELVDTVAKQTVALGHWFDRR